VSADPWGKGGLEIPKGPGIGGGCFEEKGGLCGRARKREGRTKWRKKKEKGTFKNKTIQKWGGGTIKSGNIVKKLLRGSRRGDSTGTGGEEVSQGGARPAPPK